MMRDSVRLGRIAGVSVGANWSLALLAGMIAYLLAASRLPYDAPGYAQSAYWAAGILTSVGLIVGVLLHELGHAVVARRAGLRVDGITLWFMGGMTRVEGDSSRPLTELWVAGVGPLVSVVVGSLR